MAQEWRTAYQPPLIGYKKLLNFGAYSVPDWGGYLFISAGVVLTLVVACEYYFCKNLRPTIKTPAKPLSAVVALALVLGQSCVARAVSSGRSAFTMGGASVR